MVQVDYRLFGTGWCMVDAWFKLLVHVIWCRFTAVYLIVIVRQWFHHSTYMSRRLDGERIGVCSHLLVVAGEHRGL